MLDSKNKILKNKFFLYMTELGYYREIYKKEGIKGIIYADNFTGII